MITLSPTTLFWIIASIQIVGLASLGLTRISEGTNQCQLCQLLFYVCLTLVGGSTMVCLQCRDGGWLFCAITLSVMAVGATIDCSSLPRRSVRPLA